MCSQESLLIGQMYDLFHRMDFKLGLFSTSQETAIDVKGTWDTSIRFKLGTMRDKASPKENAVSIYLAKGMRGGVVSGGLGTAEEQSKLVTSLSVAMRLKSI